MLKLRDHPPPFDGCVDEEDTPCSVSRLINKLLKCSHEGEHDQAQLSPYMSSCIYLLFSQSIMPYYGLCGLQVSVMSDYLPICFPKNNYFSEHPRPTSPSRASGGKVSNITCSQARDLVHEEARGMANTSGCRAHQPLTTGLVATRPVGE